MAVYFQRPLATHTLVHTFVQGVRHVAPPVRPPLRPCDLNLVLSVLQDTPFEDIRKIPLTLVAITSVRRVSKLAALSCKAPYLVIHRDKVVLRLQPSFLPKVVSAFHINEDIVLPSLWLLRPKEATLHSFKQMGWWR